ncbi:MAG: bifunctional diguanylate cyclase/phosphodiesterase, partial [Arenimonas sp.]
MKSTQTLQATAPVTSIQIEWVDRLADAETPREVAEVIVEMAQAEPACKSADVFWDLSVGGQSQREPATRPEDGALELAHSAAASGVRASTPDGGQTAIPLFESVLFQANPAILVIAMDSPSSIQAFLDATTPLLQLAGRHLHRALEAAQLKASLVGLERSELLQRSLFAISDLAGSDCDMPELLKGIHAIVDSLMYAKNCFIVRLDAERDLIRFLYFVDT